MGSLETVYNFQAQLSRAQAIPLIGFTLISPSKAVVSIAQIVAGIAAGIFFGSLAVLSGFSDRPVEYTLKAFGHIGMGGMALTYSIINICTLGFAAFQIEAERAAFSR